MKTALRIPASFVLANASIDWRDLRYGLEHGFLDRDDIIAIAVDYVSGKPGATETEIELAGLLRNESYRVPELLTNLTARHAPDDEAKFSWLYLTLAWLYDQRESFPDPFELIEEIYADFDYPEDVAPFVRYMAPTDGYRPQDHSQEENRDRLYRLWQEFLVQHRPTANRSGKGPGVESRGGAVD